MVTLPIFRVGEKVRLLATGEVGIVVHAWWNPEIDGNDYYIAFFGQSFPSAEQDRRPYMLRYSETSLETVGS